MDIFSRSGDIRDQSLKWSKIDRNFACFWPPDFFGGVPPIFWTCIINLGQILTMWQSFRAIGRGNSENAWRKKRKKKNITIEHFISPPVTTVHGRPNNAVADQTSSLAQAEHGAYRDACQPVDAASAAVHDEEIRHLNGCSSCCCLHPCD